MNTALFEFLRALRANNNKKWFQENKPHYDRLRAYFVDVIQQLIHKIAVFDSEIAGLDARKCIYRIYRDIRFSADKTPYKTHFGAYLAGYGGRTGSYAGYYVHLEPDNAFLSGGVWQPSPDLLKKLRQDIYDNMDEFLQITENNAFKAVYPALEGELLKRMPAGYPSDSSYAYILKHKDFIVSSSKPESFFLTDDWLDRVTGDFETLYPFNRFLNYTVRPFYEKP